MAKPFLVLNVAIIITETMCDRDKRILLTKGESTGSICQNKGNHYRTSTLCPTMEVSPSFAPLTWIFFAKPCGVYRILMPFFTLDLNASAESERDSVAEIVYDESSFWRI